MQRGKHHPNAADHNISESYRYRGMLKSFMAFERREAGSNVSVKLQYPISSEDVSGVVVFRGLMICFAKQSS